jgi:hypothetical protein
MNAPVASACTSTYGSGVGINCEMMTHAVSRVALLSALLLPASVLASDSTATEPAAAQDETAAAPVLLQIELERDGRAIRHPGHMATPGEEIILTFTIGEVDHDVEVLVNKGKGGFDVKVVYRVGDKSILEGTVKAKGKRWAKVTQKKISVGVRIDPDAKRPGQLDVPDTDDPLGGVKK